MKTLGGLKEALNRPTSVFLGDGLRRVRYPTDRIDLLSEVREHVVSCGLESPLALEDLHHRMRPEDQNQANRYLTTNLNKTIVGIARVYRDLVRYIAREVLGFDVVFEASPPLRFHFPIQMPDRFRAKDGTLIAYHTDTLVGDYFEGINCWVPLTRCFGTCALQGAPLADSISILNRFASELDFDETTYFTGRERFYQKLHSDDSLQKSVLQSCRPLEADYGEFLMFDPRIIHGTAENVEDTTRVSLDFRLVPLKAYEAIMRGLEVSRDTALEFSGMASVRGSFYDQQTGFEL